MNIKTFLNLLNLDFYTGVPDSLLSPLCDYLLSEYGENNNKHIIAANEGNAVGVAAGYYLSTGKVPCVYLQNSGEGNIINPIASLLNKKVYGIPMVFIVGWRGKPGTKDEPQHVFQGEITISLMESLGIATCVIRKDTTESETKKIWRCFCSKLAEGEQVAFVVEKDALEKQGKQKYSNSNELKREDIIGEIVKASGEDVIISSTGKIGRELFEIRDALGQGHDKDFLTVGSMGHASSIALGIALQRRNKKIWCIDGDGAALMHMGAIAVIGKTSPNNLIHVIINNFSHESVGGLPTAGEITDFSKVAKACGYKNSIRVNNKKDLIEYLDLYKGKDQLSMIEVLTKIGSRPDLGRPTISPRDNMYDLMKNIK